MHIDMTTDSPSQLRDLHTWLLRDPELRGRVRLRRQPPPPEALGALTDAVEVALGPGGALTALAGAVVVWLRSRKGSVTLKLTRDGDSVELTAQGVHGLTPAEIRALIEETASTLSAGPEITALPDPADGG